MILPLLFAFQQAIQAASDTTIFPPRETVMRLYTNCDEDHWPWGTAETYVPKTGEEITSGIARRRALEASWRQWYASHGGDALPVTPDSGWGWPLAVKGRLLDNFANPRVGSLHEALDIFVPREGVAIRSPVNGLVVASGDQWQGRYRRGRGDGLVYSGDGLSRRAGNGVIVFDPGTGHYLLFSHMQAGLPVHAGDVVRAGQQLGTVGHTGNAIAPGHGRHLHFAYKAPGNGCGFEGVLVSVDPYRELRAARSRFTPATP